MKESHMATHQQGEVRSTDGTTIAFQRTGDGPPIVLVDPAGGFSGLDNIRGLSEFLAADFTIYSYDRRGRGGSADTAPYALEREVEDLTAVVTHAGGSAFAYGFSSGALLACHASAAGVPLERLALLEPPFATADGLQSDPDLERQITELVHADRRGDAVTRWLDAIGVPPEMIEQMAPARPALESIAHTLVYDLTIVSATTPDTMRSVPAPALIVDSDASDPKLRAAAAALATALPAGTHRTLPGEWHGVDDEVLAPIIREFFMAQMADQA
jgi:pimeloyl-ACP methyl ester carboxylesterase